MTPTPIRRKLRLPQLSKRNGKMKRHHPANEFIGMCYRMEHLRSSAKGRDV